jgi:phosphoserine phosphatase
MAIKLLALDYDGIIPEEESPLFLFDKLGKRAESDLLANEFYAGLANAKNEKERDAVPGGVWKKSFALYRQFPMKKMKRIMGDLKFVAGAKELFNYCAQEGIKTAIVSATVRPILEWNLSAHKLRPDYLLCSECTIKHGRFERLSSVMSPMEKRRSLEKLLKKEKSTPQECLVVGDAFSEIPMFEFVGKENSVAFNYRQDLEKYCGHLLFKQDDPKRDLRKIIDVIEKSN